MADALDSKIARLRETLQGLGRVVVCFSGGVDSSYLLAEAVGVLGDEAVALTAVSPSLAPEEREAARALAARLGARHRLVETHELDDARYATNPVNRCYFCKNEVYGVAVRAAEAEGIGAVLDGFNVDDRGDHRPGRKAARERGVASPLDACGFGKAEIREAARRLGLPVWDKPALACLASRFPYGARITAEGLGRVARSERVLRDLGFRVVRVRHHGEMARIEVARDEVPRLLEVAGEVAVRLKAEGFTYVTVDLEGYRTGSMNESRGPAAPSGQAAGPRR